MTFAEKLKELRRQAGLSQAQLAQKSGLSVDAIRDYEYGRREPSLKNGFRLAAALGTDCRAFAGTMEPHHPPASPQEGERQTTQTKKGQGKARPSRRKSRRVGEGEGG